MSDDEKAIDGRRRADWSRVADPVPPGYERDLDGQITIIPERLEFKPSRLKLSEHPELWEITLSTYARTGRWSAAAKMAGVSTYSIQKLRSDNAEFDELCSSAESEYEGTVLAEVHRRAIEGIEEPIVAKGEIIGVVRRYSDRLLELEARRVSKQVREATAPQGSKTTVNVNTSATVSNIHAIVPDLASMPRAQRDQVRLLLAAMTPADSGQTTLTDGHRSDQSGPTVQDAHTSAGSALHYHKSAHAVIETGQTTVRELESALTAPESEPDEPDGP